MSDGWPGMDVSCGWNFSSFSEYFELLAVLWHCRLSDRIGIQPQKKTAPDILRLSKLAWPGIIPGKTTGWIRKCVLHMHDARSCNGTNSMQKWTYSSVTLISTSFSSNSDIMRGCRNKWQWLMTTIVHNKLKLNLKHRSSLRTDYMCAHHCTTVVDSTVQHKTTAVKLTH